MTSDTVTAFNQLELDKALLKALDEVGYETPSPIQAETIPLLLDGRDIIGQAQTGTGKTAAFALPLLSNLDLKQKDPQVLVLAPTRELAIQVAEAFQKYARHLKGFHVLPIYGGQEYGGQIRALKRGVHVIVGTPGRTMDHMRKGTLKLNNLKTLVLDEADEMLRMGFIDDVEWVLEQTPPTRQIALFSATMPQQIRRIATKYLNNPEHITIKVKTATAETIRQRYVVVNGMHNKLEALTRILEAETFEAMLIFVRTKTATVELAEKLEARGYSSAALNGDIAQNQRERTINRLKKGQLDLLVATDVAARGLDVDRISHVINFDIPHDTESYVHRIGRTGRAGREGDAILFMAPRERRMLGQIEKATRKKIDQMELPSTDVINDKRIVQFKQRITDTIEAGNLDFFAKMISEYQNENDTSGEEIAAALAHLLQGNTPFLLKNMPTPKKSQRQDRNDRNNDRNDRKPRRERNNDRSKSSRKDNSGSEQGMQRYRIEVGNDHDVRPSNIVGAIANEAGIDSQYIGRISIRDDHSVVDLPEGMPSEVFDILKKVWVSGQRMNISRFSGEMDTGSSDGQPKPRSTANTKRRSGSGSSGERTPGKRSPSKRKPKRED